MIVCKNGFSWRNRFTPSTDLVIDVQNSSSLAIPLPTCKIYGSDRFFEKIKGSGYSARNCYVTDRNCALAGLQSPVAAEF